MKAKHSVLERGITMFNRLRLQRAGEETAPEHMHGVANFWRVGVGARKQTSIVLLLCPVIPKLSKQSSLLIVNAGM